jgi:hypothetical protein
MPIGSDNFVMAKQMDDEIKKVSCNCRNLNVVLPAVNAMSIVEVAAILSIELEASDRVG